MTSSHKYPGQPALTNVFCPLQPLIGYTAPTCATRRFTQGPASVTLRADRSELVPHQATFALT